MSNKISLPASKQILLRHLAAWLSIVIYYIIYSTIEGSALVKTAWIFLLIINYSFAYYTLVLFIWPKIISEKKWIYSILIISSFILFCSFFYFQLTVITPWLGGIHPMIYWPFNEFINNALKLFSYILFTSIGTYYNWIGIKKIEEDLKMDKDIIEMEFLFLKNQFHSHLTFNFLNFCYNKIHRFSPLTSSSIEGFSDILRYSLNTSNKPVILEKEIEYIANYISFQKFLTPNIDVQISHKGDLTNSYILAKTLATFIEFFFQDKLFNVSQRPNIFFIESTQNEIIFKIKNTKNRQKKIMPPEELQNFEQLLQSFYGNNYSLKTYDNNDFFSWELNIKKSRK